MSNTVVTTGSTYDNKWNLPERFFHNVIGKMEGTTVGRQEIYADLFREAAGALWSYAMIEDNRDTHRRLYLDGKFDADTLIKMTKIVVSVDPATKTETDSDETGIIVCGRDKEKNGYVLEDQSGKHTPKTWATIACELYEKYQADSIVAEVNNGGDLVITNIRTVDTRVPIRTVHASRGKRARAEPVASLYEKGDIHHLETFESLENEMVSWEPNTGADSPSRLDALVWGITELDLPSHAVFEMATRRSPRTSEKARQSKGASFDKRWKLSNGRASKYRFPF